MNMPPSKEPYDGYCGTSYAAKMLGISVGTVQATTASEANAASPGMAERKRMVRPRRENDTKEALAPLLKRRRLPPPSAESIVSSAETEDAPNDG